LSIIIMLSAFSSIVLTYFFMLTSTEREVLKNFGSRFLYR
jgi:hypothetical protein